MSASKLDIFELAKIHYVVLLEVVVLCPPFLSEAFEGGPFGVILIPCVVRIVKGRWVNRLPTEFSAS